VSQRFLKFLIVSGVAAAANIGSRVVFNVWMGYVPAILLAFCVGLTTAFVLNRIFVFKETVNPLHRQAFWFTVVNLAAVVQTLVVSLLLARWLFPSIGFDWHDETVAHAFGVAVPVLTSFVGHKRLSFRAGERSR
jgi:putative flippase GtrA